jgi:hypothetical protein
MIDEIKMRLKKSAALPKRKNDKPFASDCNVTPQHLPFSPLISFKMLLEKIPTLQMGKEGTCMHKHRSSTISFDPIVNVQHSM